METNHRSPAGGVVATCADEDKCEVFSCEVCLREIPDDAVSVTDAQDYVHHFCGLECLAIWQKRGRVSRAGPPGKGSDRIK